MSCFPGQHNSLKSLYSHTMTPMSHKKTRHISSTADKILDAPDIRDDFCKFCLIISKRSEPRLRHTVLTCGTTPRFESARLEQPQRYGCGSQGQRVPVGRRSGKYHPPHDHGQWGRVYQLVVLGQGRQLPGSWHQRLCSPSQFKKKMHL